MNLYRIRFCSIQCRNKILKKLDVAKAFRIDQISTKFLKDGAPRITIHLCSINFISSVNKTGYFSVEMQDSKNKTFVYKEN